LFYQCYAYSKLGRYDKLFPCLDSLQRKVDKGDYKLFVFDFRATPSLLRSIAWMDLGNYPRALEEAQKGYELAKTYKTYLQMWIYALTAMGLANALDGHPAEAGQIADELEKVNTGYPHTLLAKDKFIGLARIYMGLGDYQRALKAIRHAQETSAFEAFTDLITGASLAGQSVFTYWELPRQYILNRCLLETGDIKGAKTGYSLLMNLPQTRQNGDIYWLILFDLGRIAEAENKIEEAIEYYRRAIEIIEQQRSTIHSETSKIGFVGNKQGLYHRMIASLFSLDRTSEAFEYAERAKARALVDMLAARQNLALPVKDADQVKQVLARLNQAESEFRVQGHRISTEQYDKNRGLVVRLKEELREKAPDLASLVTVTAYGADEIRSRIPSDETLVEYYYQGGDLYAFILNRKGLKGVKLKAGDLAELVSKMRQAIMDTGSSEYLRISRTLYDRLIAPIRSHLDGPNLLIIPHGVLHYLPFNTLVSDSQYLIDQYSIRMLPSSSVLMFLKAHSDRQDSLMALGNPDLGDARLDLRFAQEEVRTIAASHPNAIVLLRKDATETAVKESGGRFKYVHFATHGTFSAEAPLDSGLLLVRDQQNDGVLTVGELYALRFDADLVTLSACETALGKVESGDDVVGFTRAFLYAGTNSIISTLWSVDDRATFKLMKIFYEGLPGMSKRDALRRAQLAVRAHYPHPFYWAAFQYTGVDS
jgi:CHAT domain-containing protein